ncbi:hypothetical protein Tco_1055275 [Tanacetum coccineum]|uniref:Uncharacterized protein n=1 Tax=Tanacetum coccineum TaxID=301880 RepID=A0ABQ5H1J4_9ASTR
MKTFLETLFDPAVVDTSLYVLKFENTLKEEMREDLSYFNSLEKKVESLKSQPLKQKNEFSKTNDRLLEECMAKDLMSIILSYYKDIDEYMDMACQLLEKTAECENLETELSKLKRYFGNKSNHKLLLRFASLEKHSNSLEFALRHNNEKLVYENSWRKQYAKRFHDYSTQH